MKNICNNSLNCCKAFFITLIITEKVTLREDSSFITAKCVSELHSHVCIASVLSFRFIGINKQKKFYTPMFYSRHEMIWVPRIWYYLCCFFICDAVLEFRSCKSSNILQVCFIWGWDMLLWEQSGQHWTVALVGQLHNRNRNMSASLSAHWAPQMMKFPTNRYQL